MDSPSTQPIDQISCPSCGKTMLGNPSTCSFCGADLRGLGDSGETLVPELPRERGGSWMPGTLIDKRYRLLEKLGEGGMGTVYKAEHVRMGKIVALKLLQREAALDRTALKRFQQEARTVSRLSHPNTVSVFDFGAAGDGSLYMAMEYVPGSDLATLIAEKGALPERRAIPIAAQVLRSLADAHEAGVVHRDIKPANVMLQRTREGLDFVKVVDFGIAKVAEAALGKGSRKPATGRADLVGTPHYMSPEQIRGEELDGRSDLYSLAAMLFELLTGRCLFGDDTPLVIASRHLNDPPPLPSMVAPGLAVSASLEQVLQKALAKDRRDRFQGADEMRAALLASLPPSPGAADALAGLDPIGPGGADLEILNRDQWDAFEHRLRLRRRLAPLAAIAALGLAGSIGWRLLQEPPEPERTPVTMEVEPNDGPALANLIEPGTEVRGFIRRSAREQSDFDLFELEVPGFEPSKVDVRVSAVPNVNLAIDLFALRDTSASGSELPNLGHVDDRFIGGAEAMTDLVLPPGRYLVRLCDKRRADEGEGTPRENTLDPYALEVALSPLPAFHEREPNNSLEEAMRLPTNRPVLGRIGARAEPTTVQVASGQPARVARLWSEDYFELELPEGATSGCALVGGARGAVLALATVSTEHRRLGLIADTAERERSLGEHLAAMARERPTRIGPDEFGRKCARSTESVVFRLEAAEGGSDEPYLFVGLDDSNEGFDGALRACDALIQAGQAQRCKTLLAKALQAIPSGKGAEKARRRTAEIP